MSLKLQGSANLPEPSKQRRFEDTLPPGTLPPEEQLSQEEGEYVEELTSIYGLATGNPAFGRFSARRDLEAIRRRNVQLDRRIKEAARTFVNAAIPGSTIKRKLLRGWKDICAAVEMDHTQSQTLKRLNAEAVGPIKSRGPGKLPEVWEDELRSWWADRERKHDQMQQAAISLKAEFAGEKPFGRSGSVIPTDASYDGNPVKKRRKDFGLAKKKQSE
jgi:hypothetical protein